MGKTTGKLSDRQVQAIRLLVARGAMPRKVIAQRFDVSMPTISHIANRKTHAALPDVGPEEWVS